MPAVDGPGEWEVEFYADESGREPCREWMGKLTPLKRIALEEAIRLVLVRRGLDVVETEFGKALGGGLCSGCAGRLMRCGGSWRVSRRRALARLRRSCCGCSSVRRAEGSYCC